MDDVASLWGKDICLLAGCDAAYLPGFYGLVNSARANHFAGRIILLASETFDRGQLPDSEEFEVLTHPENPTIFGPAEKLAALPGLPSGKYLLLDTDFLIERPCAELLEPIDAGLLVSTEIDPKYEPFDTFVYQQCKALGWSSVPAAYPYLNCGLIGFQMPRDRDLMRAYAEETARCLVGVKKVFSHPWFLFPEQDIFNLLVRRSLAEGKQVFSISPRSLELGFPDGHMFDRRFPHVADSTPYPKDQTKYLIHGASLRRPWLTVKEAGWKGMLERTGVLPWRRNLRGKMTPYERAWAYFACSPGMAIPVECWAEKYRFTAHRQPLWRRAYGLRD